jgi:hypothetical protein
MVGSPVLAGLLDEQAEAAARMGALTVEETDVMASLGHMLDAPEVRIPTQSDACEPSPTSATHGSTVQEESPTPHQSRRRYYITQCTDISQQTGASKVALLRMSMAASATPPPAPGATGGGDTPTTAVRRVHEALACPPNHCLSFDIRLI